MACATLKRSMDWEPVLGATRPAKRRRCSPFCGNHGSSPNKDRASPSQQHQSSPCSSQQTSVFPDLGEKFTPEYISENIRAELKRIQRRRQLHFVANAEQSDSSSGGEQSESPSRSDKPVFTFKQVGLICERMLREKESEIREEYDNILSSKLAEQYDAFVKFTYDQIQRNYQSVPSYLS